MIWAAAAAWTLHMALASRSTALLYMNEYGGSDVAVGYCKCPFIV